MAEAARSIDDLDSNHGESDHGEIEDELWREERRNLATDVTEAFNDELKNELKAASAYEWQHRHSFYTKMSQTGGLSKRACRKFDSYNRLFSSGLACKDHLQSWRPMVHKAAHPTTTGVYDQSVRCANFNTGAGKHLDDYHPPHTVADMDHLQRLFDNHQETAPTDVCGTWDTFHAKKRECGHDHGTFIGNMGVKTCSVVINYLVPIDIKRYPWVILSSHGIHTHAPPPPNYLPTHWGEFARSMMSKIDDPNITANKFLANKALKYALNDLGFKTLATAHAAFLQRNRIENLIRVWKTDTYPIGLDLAAVEVEKGRGLEADPEDCYIQDVYRYGPHDERFIVVCMLKEQAALFQQIKFLEVDTSMKRLKGNVNKEILFACQYDLHGKSKPFELNPIELELS
ncbi:hypothetical protein E4U22_003021 [Claviceps purpurea]|nr:hypothetical protein E4U10_002617 [Claviceps purpurea]KAG6310920.1 hypothetical protein E4U22_003021 [Claviceps purpurea]